MSLDRKFALRWPGASVLVMALAFVAAPAPGVGDAGDKGGSRQ